MPELSRIIGQSPAPALRMHIAPDTREAELSRNRLHMGRIRIRIRTQVVVHMHRDHAAARGSPARDRRAGREKHAGVHASRAPHNDRAAGRPPAAPDQLPCDLSGQRVTADARCEGGRGRPHAQMLWHAALRTRMHLAGVRSAAP